MNFLAHALLADATGDAQAGALLGDLLKRDDHLPDAVRREIRVHRAIDAYTDAHPQVLAAKRLFGSDTRRYAGILLDVFYDHVLTVHWSRYGPLALEPFVDRVHRHLLAHRACYLPRERLAVERIVDARLLTSYATLAGVEHAARRIALRLSRGGDRLIAGVDDLRRHYEPLADGFHTLFPQLRAHADAVRQAWR